MQCLLTKRHDIIRPVKETFRDPVRLKHTADHSVFSHKGGQAQASAGCTHAKSYVESREVHNSTPAYRLALFTIRIINKKTGCLNFRLEHEFLALAHITAALP